MKKYYRISAFFLSLLMIFLSVPVSLATDMPPVEDASISWSYKSGVLTLSGSGKMTDFCGDEGTNVTSAPWRDYRSSITTVVVGDSISTIGWYAFLGCSALKTVYIGKGLTDINNYAFYGCSSLKQVHFAWNKTADNFNLLIKPDNDDFNNAEWIWNSPYITDYSVNFNANGGKGTMKTRKYSIGKSVTLPANEFTRAGYQFNGWNTKKDGSGTTYKNKASVKNIAGSKTTVTLYAQWKNNTYTVKFNANGGTGTMSNQKIDRSKSVALKTNTFKHTNFTFKGWNTKKDGSGTSYANKAKVKNLASAGTSKTLYAQWKLKSGCYRINYKLNGGTNSAKNPDSYYTKGASFTLAKPTRQGYTFKGWYKDSKYKTKITKVTTGTKGTLTLYAKWDVNKYTVKFNANGGKGSMASKTYTYGKTYTLPANKFTRAGYTFAGWNTKKDGSGKAYGNKKSVKNLTTGTGTVTLYARWENVNKILPKADNVLKKTCEPANAWFNGRKVSSKTGADGRYIWSCSTLANGTLAKITAMDSGLIIAETFCMWSRPDLTVYGGYNGTQTYRSQLLDGTYDFKKDPGKVFISWDMFDSNTSLTKFRKTVNRNTSSDVFDEVKAKYNFRATSTYGGSCIIVYDKNANGELIGKYAGSLYYNNSSSYLQYYLVGIDPSGPDYGKTISKTIAY